MNNDLIKLKNNLKIALYYEFYCECLLIENKILGILVNDILNFLNIKMALSIEDAIKKIDDLDVNNNLTLEHIVKNLLKEINEWQLNCEKNQINFFGENLNKDFALNGKNLILNLENNILLLKNNEI